MPKTKPPPAASPGCDQAQATSIGLGHDIAAVGKPSHADRPVQTGGDHAARIRGAID
jgi:hypothetical protein